MENLSPRVDVNEYSKYGLVVAVAKRARQIVSRRESGVVLPHKPVTIALDEIEQGTVRIVTKEPENEHEAEQAAAEQVQKEAPGTEQATDVVEAPQEEPLITPQE